MIARKNIVVLALGVCALGGCSNIGDAPSGPTSPEAIVDAASKESPQEQIRMIQMSPASADHKAQLIKAIEDKYHVKADGTAVTAPGQSSPSPGK